MKDSQAAGGLVERELPLVARHNQGTEKPTDELRPPATCACIVLSPCVKNGCSSSNTNARPRCSWLYREALEAERATWSHVMVVSTGNWDDCGGQGTIAWSVGTFLSGTDISLERLSRAAAAVKRGPLANASTVWQRLAKLRERFPQGSVLRQTGDGTGC